jgi:hypothetical protein
MGMKVPLGGILKDQIVPISIFESGDQSSDSRVREFLKETQSSTL